MISIRPLKFGIGVALALSACLSQASSHSDAPLIKQDPQANLTDVYAFVGTKFNDANQRVLNVIVQVRPFSEPGDGVLYDRFAADALYRIHITNPVNGNTRLRYEFRFSSVNPTAAPLLKNPDTALSYGLGTVLGPIVGVGDAAQNYVQTYIVTRQGPGVSVRIGKGLLTPPPNVGLRTTPAYNDSSTGKAISGATSVGGLDAYTRTTVYQLTSGEAVFAGPRDDGFFADTAGIFDLLDPRILGADDHGQSGGGVDGFKGYNVLVFGIQIPLSLLPSFEYASPFADLGKPLPALGAGNGVGVYASVARPATRVLSPDGDPVNSGKWIQVNRMGNPLFNEALVALKDKDNYNRGSPPGDRKNFRTYALNPEVARLANEILFVGSSQWVSTGRSDLEMVFIPDVIRVDTTTPPVRLPGQAGFNRFGFAGGDTTVDNAGRIKSSGWPNGRRLGDDVVDILLTALASGPSFATVAVFGDNVAANDQLYNQVFPYAATPHAGPTNSKDP